MSLEMWAVAAVAVIDASGTPLLLRTFMSPPQVLNSPEAPQQAHLYVGPEDVVKIHFLLFAALDRCDEVWQANKRRLQAAAAARQAATSSGGPSTATGAKGGPGISNPTLSATGSRSATAQSTAGATATASVTQGRPSANTNTPPPPPPRLVTSTTDVRFMGRLIQSHRFLSYGFCSATGIQTLLVTVGAEAPQDAVLPLCRAIYEAASAALCNPFRVPLLGVRAQQALLAKEHDAIVAYRASKAAGHQGGGEAQEGEWGRGRSMVDLERSWPAAAAPADGGMVRGSSSAFTAAWGNAPQPTLALSETFNKQLEAILSTFTVTAQSCIMR